MTSPLNVEVQADAGAMARRAAQFIAALAEAAIAQRGRFVMALSGGSTPLPMFRMLAEQAIDWRHVHLVQVDERAAPDDSLDRNFAQLRRSLLAQVPVPASQVHPMPVLASDLQGAADGYGRLLVEVAGTSAVLDLVQLGIGDDGHTASLIPGDAVLDVTDADVAVTGVYNGWRRMTLTFPIINRARQILWLVGGPGKAAASTKLVEGDPTIPASHVRRERALLLVERSAMPGAAI